MIIRIKSRNYFNYLILLSINIEKSNKIHFTLYRIAPPYFYYKFPYLINASRAKATACSLLNSPVISVLSL